jgi:hypothetical protein
MSQHIQVMLSCDLMALANRYLEKQPWEGVIHHRHVE